MHLRTLFSITLLGLAGRFVAHAQTSAPAVPVTGTSLPTAVPPGMVPASATTPTSTSGEMYPNGVPTRNMNGGTQRADQPVGGSPAVTGSQPTRRLNKGRTPTPR